MSKDALAHCLDPFYTTKPPGEGTGLGLSMVHGFVAQSGGTMDVESSPGQGTTITLLLPRAEPGTGSSPTTDGRGRDADDERPMRILVVEDDALVRQAVVGMLARMGHSVVDVDSAEAALEVESPEAGPFEVLFSDVGLGGAIDGAELAARLTRRWPSMHVLLTTGYAGRDGGSGPIDLGFPILEKPYRLGDLRRRLRDVRRSGVRSR
jgi:CheY-like chemotaxis protein